MREIERTAKFRRDYRRELRGRHWATLDAGLSTVLISLMNDETLAERYRDHPLQENGSAFATATLNPISF